MRMWIPSISGWRWQIREDYLTLVEFSLFILILHLNTTSTQFFLNKKNFIYVFIKFWIFLVIFIKNFKLILYNMHACTWTHAITQTDWILIHRSTSQIWKSYGVIRKNWNPGEMCLHFDWTLRQNCHHFRIHCSQYQDSHQLTIWGINLRVQFTS